MIDVLVSKQSNYPVSTAKVKIFLKEFFKERGITSEAEVSVALVGQKKMMGIGNKYLKDNKLHNVLSFTEDEVDKDFKMPPGKLYLGEIIVCFPKALAEAKDEEKRTEDKVIELIEHGALHLMGVHHE